MPQTQWNLEGEGQGSISQSHPGKQPSDRSAFFNAKFVRPPWERSRANN